MKGPKKILVVGPRSRSTRAVQKAMAKDRAARLPVSTHKLLPGNPDELIVAPIRCRREKTCGVAMWWPRRLANLVRARQINRVEFFCKQCGNRQVYRPERDGYPGP
jgi:hypothetical protein